MAALAVPVVVEAAIAASLAPILPVVAAGAAVGAVSIQLVRWWRASTAAVAQAKAAAPAVVKAASELAAAEAVQAATAAAPAAVEAAAAGAVDTAATMSLSGLLGYGCILVAAAGGGYCLYRYFNPKTLATPRSQLEPKKIPVPPIGNSDDDNSDDENDDEKNKAKPAKPAKPRPIIPKTKMEELLKKHGEEIWRKLRNLGPDEGAHRRRRIWNKGGYRIDATGAKRLNGKEASPTIRGWELQKNQGARKAIRQNMKGSTHNRLFVDDFDTVNKPDCDTFKRSILDRYPKVEK